VVVLTDLLDFSVNDESKTADNIANWVQEVMAVYGLKFEHISVIVPDGAANCSSACDILNARSNLGFVESSFETHICDCHNLARAILYGVGQHGNKANSKNPEVRETLLQFKTIVRKFNQSPMLSKILKQCQEDDNVRVLKGKNPAVTRWGGLHMMIQSQNKNKPYIENSLLQVNEVAIPMEDDNGDVIGDSTVMVPGVSLIPSAAIWLRAREIESVLTLFHQATDEMQGNSLCDRSWQWIKHLYDMVSDEESEWQVPKAVSADGKRNTAFVTVRASQFKNDCVRQMLRVIEQQMRTRFIVPGPPTTSLINMYINPTINKSELLEDSQLTMMDIHVIKAMQAVSTAPQHDSPPPPPTQSPTFSSLPPKNIFSKFKMARRTPTPQHEHNEVSNEKRTFEALSDEDMDRYGLVTDTTEFNIFAFWAHPAVIGRFPLLTQVAMSNISAVLHEATSERTFSDCGQYIGDKRRSLKSETVCAQVLTKSGERVKEATTDEIMLKYKTSGGNPLKRKTTHSSVAGASAEEAEEVHPDPASGPLHLPVAF